MARTTEILVKEVLAPGNDYDTRRNPSLAPFIRMAGLLADRLQTCAASFSDSFTEAELAEIETWLAAHFYKVSDRPYKKKRTGHASGEFDGETKMGLNSTLYGQAALALDRQGCIDSIANNAPRMSAYWLGRRVPEQTDYDDRN